MELMWIKGHWHSTLPCVHLLLNLPRDSCLLTSAPMLYKSHNQREKDWSYCTWLCVWCVGRSQQECGNGVVEGDEECDCGSTNSAVCQERDPCCTPGNCTLTESASCRWILYVCVTCVYKRVSGSLVFTETINSTIDPYIGYFRT